MLDMRTGEPLLVRARATLLATGGGPTMYRYHTPSGDKSCDGLAMALRAGLPLRDIEMVQFHPTGLLAGEGTRMTGTVLEEGLRGSGGWLTDATGERFMFDYDPRGERATRDIVSRSIMDRIRKGFATPHGGVYIEMGHLGPERVRREFKGMVERCADCGFDLAAGRVEVIPTAHYMMGGVVFDADCTTPTAAAFTRPARTPAACTAPTASAATASPTPRCSAASPATSMGARIEPRRRPARAGQGRDRSGARARLRAVRPQAPAICRRCASGFTTSCGTTSASCARRRRLRAARRRSRALARDIAACGVADGEPPLQSDLDGPAQPGKSDSGQPRHLRRRRFPHGQPRRAFPRGLPQGRPILPPPPSPRRR